MSNFSSLYNMVMSNEILKGVVIGLIVTIIVALRKPIWSIILWPFRRDALTGVWYHHYINRKEDNFQFVQERVTIRKGIEYKLIAVFRPIEKSSKSKYVAVGHREKGFLVLEGKSSSDDEKVFQRFNLPPSGVNDLLVGLSSAQDFNGAASVNPSILSRTQLTQTVFHETIQSRIRIDEDQRVITVRSDYRVSELI